MSRLRFAVVLASVVLAAAFFGQSAESAKKSGKTITVTITPGGADAQFKPAAVKVSRGDTVVWENTDSVLHNVTFKQNGEKLYQWKIKEDGGKKQVVLNDEIFDKLRKAASGKAKLEYRCTIHPEMRGYLILVGK